MSTRLRLLVTSLLLSIGGLIAAPPVRVAADCGSVPDPDGLALYAAKYADVIVIGQLTAFDPTTGYTFDVLAEYKGSSGSPIAHAGVTDVGGCTQQSVQPGDRFVYVAGDRAGHPRMQLIFPHVPGRGWVVSHFGEYAPLQRLLGLLGVMPNTSTDTSSPGVDTQPASGLVVLLATLAALLLWRVRSARHVTFGDAD